MTIRFFTPIAIAILLCLCWEIPAVANSNETIDLSDVRGQIKNQTLSQLDQLGVNLQLTPHQGPLWKNVVEATKKLFEDEEEPPPAPQSKATLGGMIGNGSTAGVSNYARDWMDWYVQRRKFEQSCTPKQRQIFDKQIKQIVKNAEDKRKAFEHEKAQHPAYPTPNAIGKTPEW